MIRSLGNALLSAPDPKRDGLNLRLWFVLFTAWLVGLALLSSVGLDRYEQGMRYGMALWLLGLFVFYMSLCCTFFPAPTTWIVMLMASPYVAGELGVEPFYLARMVIVATAGALGTAMANLNEYHIWTFILRYGKVANIRNTRLYRIAARWFGVRPFWTIVLFSFIPIPVDVIRWLAITYRYPRGPYFLAYYLGRWVRYACLAAITIWGQLTWWHILLVQCTVAVIALGKIIQQLIRQHRAEDEGHAEGERVPADSDADRPDDIMAAQTQGPPEVSNGVG